MKEVTSLAKEFLKAPAFEDDPHKTRVAGHVRLVVRLCAIVIVLFWVLLAINGLLTARWHLTIPTVLTLLGTWMVLRRGYVYLAANLLITGLWLNLLWAAMFTGGVRGVVYGAMTVIVLLAGLLMGMRGALTVTGLSMLAGIGLAWGAENGRLPTTGPTPTLVSVLVGQVIIFLATTFLLYVTTNSIQSALDQAQVELEERQRVEEEIRRLNEELEQRVADRTRELLALYQVTAVASQPLDLDTTLTRLLERVLDVIRSDIGFIHLWDEAEGTLRLAAQQGVARDLVPRIESLPVQEGLSEWVTEHDEPLVLSDVTSDPGLPFQDIPVPHGYIGMPMRTSGRSVGVLSILRETAQPQFSAEELALLTSIADQVGAVVDSAQLRQLAEQAAVMEERQRLARDLHDSVTQSLYSLTLLAEGGRRLVRAGTLENAEDYFADLWQIALQSLKEMRLLIYELRPLVLEEEGLVGALQQRLDAVEGRTGVEARLLVEEEGQLAAPVEEALYRIAVEALNNTLKHAAATSVTVRICIGDERVELEIADNGRGFDSQAITDKGGMGLVAMQERTERLGGTLQVISAPGEGTTVRVEIK